MTDNSLAQAVVIAILFGWLLALGVLQPNQDKENRWKKK